MMLTNSILPPLPFTQADRDRLEKIEGIVFDIQRYSLHDGPGLRTNVFLKGCPLRCQWCANPESQRLQPELALFSHNCIACGQFEEVCPVCWGGRNGGWTQEQEEKYSQRALVCPTGAIHWIGRRRAAGEIIQEVLRDAPFYEDGGGMTLTGGEPTFQPELAEALLRLAKAENLSTAMETCGYTRWVILERLLPYLDHILFDLKHVDSDLHRAFTGLDNELILSNLRRLAAVEAPVTVRVPLIPGFNASSDSLRAIAEFVRGLNGSIMAVDLLPYHTLGKAKYKALGREYPWPADERLTGAEVQALAGVVELYGLAVNSEQ
ncbi:MAG: glycyl-radical enzyme activating protein [Chloroflexota bacterium]